MSLDSLDEGQFKILTRRSGVDRVLAGIAAARRVGYQSIKINAVAMKGVTENQVVPLARYCRDNGLELRFIEFMGSMCSRKSTNDCTRSTTTWCG